MSNGSSPKLARLKLISLAIQQSVREENWSESQALLAERAAILEDLSHESDLSQEQLQEVSNINSQTIELSQVSIKLLKSKMASQKRSKNAQQKLLPETSARRLDHRS